MLLNCRVDNRPLHGVHSLGRPLRRLHTPCPACVLCSCTSACLGSCQKKHLPQRPNALGDMVMCAHAHAHAHAHARTHGRCTAMPCPRMPHQRTLRRSCAHSGLPLRWLQQEECSSVGAEGPCSRGWHSVSAVGQRRAAPTVHDAGSNTQLTAVGGPPAPACSTVSSLCGRPIKEGNRALAEGGRHVS